MSRFFVKGVIIKKVRKRYLTPEIIVKTIYVEERVNSKIFYHYINFLGKYASLLPEDINLVGAEIFASGTLEGVQSKNKKTCFEKLMGDQINIIGFPNFQGDTNEN